MSDNTNPPADAVEKVADEVKETTEKVADTPPAPVTKVADEPVDPDLNAKVDTLAEKVDQILNQMGSLATAPVEPEMPGAGEVVTDASPVKGPWTHRSLFGKG